MSINNKMSQTGGSRCGICKEEGHNRRTCSKSKQIKWIKSGNQN